MQVEFWHGNCSTFALISSEPVRQMYAANIISIGNFYTGEVDRLDISCTDRSLLMRKKSRIGDMITLFLLGIVVCVMCIVGFYYGKRENNC